MAAGFLAVVGSVLFVGGIYFEKNAKTPKEKFEARIYGAVGAGMLGMGLVWLLL